MLNYNVKFLTCDDILHLKSNDFKSYKYETKKKVDESIYDAGKRGFCEHRGGQWLAQHPRQIRQLESKLRDQNIVSCEWTNDSLITMVFSSGTIAYLTVKPDTLDVTKVLFDRYCVGKLSGQIVSGVVLSKTHLLFTHADRLATLVTFGKSSISSQPCRITDREPHLQTIELSGGARRTERRVSWYENSIGVQVLVWGATAAEPAPWSPVLEDHANLHLYQISGQHATLIAYHQLENETLSAELSCENDNTIHVVEQIAYQKNGVSIEWQRYSVPCGGDKPVKVCTAREGATRVALPAPARCSTRRRGRLLVACIDGSLHVIHRDAGLVHTTRPGFIATEVRWAGELIIATEEGGQLQCFDRALSLLHHHTKCLDLSSYLRNKRRLQILATQDLRSGPLVLASFAGGPLALLRIAHPRILTAWIRAGRTSNAVALVRAMDWEREGGECSRAIAKLVHAGLRSGSVAGTSPAADTSATPGASSLAGEAAAQAALGAFLAPPAPLPRSAARYAPHLHDLARKFFHHLLRRGRLEKALSLAVDLSAWDLFADARWAARRARAPALALEAAALAAHHAHHAHHTRNRTRTGESECSESCSQCSSGSYSSGSEDETNASSEAVKSQPPPLPRIPFPQQPTVMPVPITQNEPLSTNSIRPNLHQYLERDNTIWNTEVKGSIRGNEFNRDHFKPILNTQNVKLQSVDNLFNFKQGPSKHNTLISISEASLKQNHTVIDVIPRPHDDRMAAAHFRHLFQTELREEAPSTMYRYQNSSYSPGTTVNDRPFKHEVNLLDRTGTRSHIEKNKVKFSDTVTIAVVSEASACPDAARELADSLPLCAPHNYLAAFAPHPPPAGTTLDYVEV